MYETVNYVYKIYLYTYTRWLWQHAIYICWLETVALQKKFCQQKFVRRATVLQPCVDMSYILVEATLFGLDRFYCKCTGFLTSRLYGGLVKILKIVTCSGVKKQNKPNIYFTFQLNEWKQNREILEKTNDCISYLGFEIKLFT